MGVCSLIGLRKKVFVAAGVNSCSCCCSLNTLRVTRYYVHPHLHMYKYRYTAQGERIGCATVFNCPALYGQPHHVFGGFLSPFPGE